MKLSNEDLAMLVHLVYKEMTDTARKKITGMTMTDLEAQGNKLGHLQHLLRTLREENIRRTTPRRAFWASWF